MSDEKAIHPWAFPPGLFLTACELHQRIVRLEGGLAANHAELDALIHKYQRLALEAHVAESSPAALFSEEERAALAAIDQATNEALAMTPDPAVRASIEDARLGLRNFVFQAARQRSGAPDTGRWFWGHR